MKRTVWLLLAIYVLLAVTCSIVNPIFEAPDEHHHYFTARQVSRTGRLPVFSAGSLAGQEAAQPPLYYLLASVLIALTDTSPAEPELWYNPYVQPGRFDTVFDANAFGHTPAESWPWRGTALAVHAVRFLSVLLGLGTLLCIYAAARLLWPDAVQIALLATAIAGFLPQVLFLHSAVTNDTLTVFLCSAALWQSIRAWREGLTPGRALALGITAGLAAMSKTTGVLLLALVLPLVAGLAWPKGKWAAAQYVGLVLIPAALLAGWVYWRNYALYGDLFAVSAFIERAGGDRGYTALQALGDLDRVWQSSIAVFGWMNVTAPPWVYALWNGIVVAGAAGLIIQGLRAVLKWLRPGRGRPAHQAWWPVIGCLILWPLLVFGAWLQFAMHTPADQGRLLFPAILPVSVALALGLSAWSRRWSFPVASFLALVTSVSCICILLPETYRQPTTLEEASLPPGIARLDQEMGFGLELVAVEVGTPAAGPGQVVELSLFWRKLKTPTDAARVTAKVLGREHAQIGALPATYHLGGLYPPTLWPEKMIVKEQLRLRLEDEIATPTIGRVTVELETQARSVEVGVIKVVPDRWPPSSKTVVAQVGEGIALVRADLGATTVSQGAAVPVSLRWQISQEPGRDLITFVHLGDPTAPPVSQADGPALGGDYPARLWAAGESFDDQYVLHVPADLPPGRYPVRVGLYDPNTGERLPLTIEGERQSHDALLVGWITVD